jgi:hypothetical protein
LVSSERYHEIKLIVYDIGFDTVGLGYTNLTGPTLPNQIVSAIVSDDFWFGIFGLGFQPTNFTGYDDPQPSFTDTLYTSGEIASRSWSYTAGAYYRLKSVFGSLIFGGYDASRFTPNDVIFTMTDDNLRDIVITIRSITSDTESGSATLLEEPEFAFIDSAVPELWLPVSVCEAFERTFGLELDEPSGMYLLNESAHTKLQDLNPNITFTLANQKSGGETTDIVFPYAAFDLNVSAPIVNNKTEWYFPIRRGEEGKYTLGRTFLQEAYVTTHYESRTFNVSQCVFEDGGKSHIIALPAVLSTESEDSGSGSGSGSETASGKKKKLGTGAIVGIVIGILALFLILGLLVFLCLRRRKRRSKMEEVASAHDDAIEIDTGKRLEKPGAGGRWTTAYGEQASSFTNEVPGNDAKVEIEGNPIMIPQELEADVPSTSSQQTNTMPGHGRTPMAELNAEQRGLGSGVAGGRDRDVDLVSPNTETYRSSVIGRDGPSIAVSTPTGSEGNWTPSTPIQRGGTGGSRFRERLSEDKPAG